MMKNNSYVKKVQQDIKELENKINPSNTFLLKRLIAKNLVRFGIAVEYSLPVILSFLLLLSIREKHGRIPFKIDKIVDTVSVQNIDTSSDIHIEFLSSEKEYCDTKLEYSTGWKLNSIGLYERTSTSYIVNDDIDLTDSSKIFSMSNDELNNAFVIDDVRTITKLYLDDLDKIYTDDVVVITSNNKNYDEIVRDETKKEDLADSILYIFCSLCLGVSIDAISSILIGNKINLKLKKYAKSFGPFDERDVNYMIQMLEIKQENLNLLLNNNDDDKTGFSYRKVRR